MIASHNELAVVINLQQITKLKNRSMFFEGGVELSTPAKLNKSDCTVEAMIWSSKRSVINFSNKAEQLVSPELTNAKASSPVTVLESVHLRLSCS